MTAGGQGPSLAPSGAAVPAFCLRGVSADLGARQVLRQVDLTLQAGQWISVVGPNGAGKSTLLKVLAGLLPASGGIEWQGRPLARWTRRERARALSWLGQGEVAVEDLSVWDVVMLGRLPHQAWLAAPNATDEQAVHDALRSVQAWDWRQRPLAALSGGERQRVLLARALAVQAPLLLMDEPLANLDPPHQADWIALVRRLTATGCTVVSVLHEISVALHADTMVVIKQGQVVHHGASHEAATHRRLEQVFEHRVAIHPLQGQWVALPVC